VFCARALSGIGRLPDTVADRSIPIRLKRRAPTEHVERFRRRRVEPDAERLRIALELLADMHSARLADAEPELPEALDDRAWDAVEPLLGIAEIAGPDWASRAREALLHVYGARELDDESTGLRLLADIRAVFAERGAERLPSEGLLEALCQLPENPWAEWFGKPLSTRGLAKLLKPYAIAPHSDGNSRGYKRDAFEDAWGRYLASQASEASETQSQSAKSSISIRQSEGPTDAYKSGASPHWDGDPDGLTDTAADEAQAELERLRRKGLA